MAARLAQGAAGALLVPSALAVVTAIHDDPEERGAAIGAWAAWGGAVGVVGPLAGGWLVDALGWRAVFFVNLPVVAAALFLLLRRVPETRDRSVDPRLDWAGALLVLAGLGGVAYGLIQGPSLGWARPDVRAALALGLLALAAFVAWERRAAAPLLPLHLFASRNFSGANAVTLALYAAVGATLFVLMIFLQNAAGWPALRAGLTVLPLPAVMLLLAGRFGRLAGRLGARWFMTAGPLVSAGGLALLATIGGRPSMARVLAAMAVFALGLALTVAPLTGTVMSSVPERSYGRASAVNNAASRVAQLLAVTASGLVLSATFAAELEARTARLDLSPADRARLSAVADSPTGGARLDGLSPAAANASDEAFEAAYRRAMLLAAGAAALGGVIAAVSIRDGGRREGEAPAPSAGSEHWPCLASRGAEEAA